MSVRTHSMSLIGVVIAVVASALGAPPSAGAAGGPESVLVWGYNADGELGTGGTADLSLPGTMSASGIPAGTTITQTAAGATHSLALSSTGQLYAWGDNSNGQLGDGSTTSSSTPVAVAAGAIPAGTTITQIAAGNRFSIAMSSTGQLYAWGLNNYGQLGNGSTTNSSVPFAVAAGAIPAGTTITQIVAGATHSLALSSTGQLYVWGENNFGQLGDGTNTARLAPVAASFPAGTTITQIAAGASHSLALSSSGQLYAWGYNGYGQLATGCECGAYNSPIAEMPGEFPQGTRLTQIAAGQDHSLALSSTGQLYAWGYNGHGQLGDGTTINAPYPVMVSPGAIPPGTAITQITASADHSLALSSSGHLYAWGDNTFGQLGNNTTTDSALPLAVSVGSATAIDAIARGAQANQILALVGLMLTTSGLPAGTVGVPYTAVLTASDGQPSETWSASGLPVGLALNPATGQITGTPTTPGSANVSTSVTDARGLTAGATLPITIGPAPSGPPPSVPPKVTNYRITNNPFVVGSARTPIFASAAARKPKNRKGTTFKYALSEAATVKIVISQRFPGRRQGKNCVAPTRRLRHAKRCMRMIVKGTLTRMSHQGTNKVSFSGRIGSKALKPSDYEATLTATDTAKHSSKPQTISFTIVSE